MSVGSAPAAPTSKDEHNVGLMAGLTQGVAQALGVCLRAAAGRKARVWCNKILTLRPPARCTRPPARRASPSFQPPRHSCGGPRARQSLNLRLSSPISPFTPLL